MASRSLGSLTIDLIAKTGGFTGPLSKAEREAQKRLSSIEKRAQAFGKALGSSLKIGAVAAVAGITLITKQAIDAADQMRDLSIRLGTSTEALSVFGYAASQTGTDIDTLGRGLKILAKNAVDALKPTSEQAKVFGALGISVQDSTGKMKDLSVLVHEIADSFKGLEDGTTKAALAQSLFGKSGLDLTEFLNQGSEGLDEFTRKAEELGIVIDSKTAAAADEFKDGFGDLKAAVGGLGLGIARELLPSLNSTVTSLSEFVKEGDLAKNIATLISAALRAGVAVLEGYGNAVDRVSISFGFAANAAKGFAEIQSNLGPGGLFASGSVAGGMQKVKDALATSQKELDDLIKRQNKPIRDLPTRILPGASSGPQTDQLALQRALAGVGGSKKAKGGKSDAEKEAESLQRAYESMNERLKEQVALFGVTGEAAQLRYELENGELSKLTQTQKDGLIAQAERLDVMREESEVAKELLQIEERRRESTQDIIKDLEFETQMLGKTVEEQEKINLLRYAGVNANDAYGQSIMDMADKYQELRKSTEDQIRLMDGVRGAAQGFFETVQEGGNVWDAFLDGLDEVRNMLSRMISEKLVEQLFGQMGSTNGGSAGGGFDWASLFGSIFGGAKAGGGAVNSGMFYQVNENGPEMLSVGGRDFLMMGNKSGQITPNHQLGGKRAGDQYISFNVQGTADRRSREQIAMEMRRQQLLAGARS